MSADTWPHGEHVTSARGLRIRHFYPKVITSYAEIADMRELVELGSTVEEVAAGYGVSVEKLSRLLGGES